jgi:hypothetical protein
MKLRFSIRDLLWLTLMVALVVGWYVDRSRLAVRQEQADDKAAKATKRAEIMDRINEKLIGDRYRNILEEFK